MHGPPWAPQPLAPATPAMIVTTTLRNTLIRTSNVRNETYVRRSGASMRAAGLGKATGAIATHTRTRLGDVFVCCVQGTNNCCQPSSIYEHPSGMLNTDKPKTPHQEEGGCGAQCPKQA